MCPSESFPLESSHEQELTPEQQERLTALQKAEEERFNHGHQLASASTEAALHLLKA